jgi:tetratricopeptide (TPR) repeat protein
VGKSALQQKDYGESRASFEAVIRLEPDNPEGYFRMGSLCLAENKPDNAIEYLQKALERNPNQMEAFTNLVLAYTVKNDMTAAFSACDKQLLRVDGNLRATAVTHNLKGVLYLQQQNSTEAERQFKEAVLTDSNYLPPYYALARLYLAEKQADRAIAQFNKTLEKNPDQTAAHMFLGMIYDSKQDPENAEKHYRAALDVDPEFAPAANNLAYLLADSNRDLNEALKLANIAKKSDPEDPSIADTLGWVYYKRGLYPNAVSELTFAAEKLPDNPTVRYHLGMSYLKKGDTEKARKELEKALSLDGSFEGSAAAKKALAGL